jgi:hypothetical protein
MPSRSPSAGIRRASSFVNRNDQPIEGKVATAVARDRERDDLLKTLIGHMYPGELRARAMINDWLKRHSTQQPKSD